MTNKVSTIEKGDIIEVKLDNLAYGGERVGHYNGMAVFVDKGVPSEKVRVKITNKKKNYAKAEMLEVIDESQNRVSAKCSIYDDCGGCQLQEIDYNYQLSLKKEIIKDALTRIGNLKNVKVNDIIAMDYPWYYRNKAQFPLKENNEGKIMAGFYKKGSHDIVPLSSCPIQHQLINRIAQKTLKEFNNNNKLSVYNENKHKGFLRHLIIRVGVCTNQATLTIVTNGHNLNALDKIANRLMKDIPELVGVLQNINKEKTNVIMGEKTKVINGNSRYRDYINSIKYDISVDSFFQTNTMQTDKLYNTALEYANFKGNETLIDCYCGTGSIGLYMANEVKKVIGIDLNSKAIKDAKDNARINNIKNADFIVADLREKIKEIMDNHGGENTTLLFDPPRKGLNDKIINTVLDKMPEKVIYISCNPTTLARDLKKFNKKYEIKEIQGVDMFPQTYHIESVTLLQKR